MPEFGKGLPEILSESPRDVYAAGCRSIADALAADGFTYAKSSQTATRKGRDFTFRISFQSSHHNIRGELVALWIHAVIYSPTLKKWRGRHPHVGGSWDRVAGGQIGNLVSPHSWMEWNLGPPADRERQIADAVATIRRIALPYFTRFEDVPGLVARLATEAVPSFDLDDTLDFLMCFGDPADAARAARGVLRRFPEARQEYPAALARIRDEGAPDHGLTTYGEILAAATVLFGLPDLAADPDPAEAGR
jgi:hypothetical protein